MYVCLHLSLYRGKGRHVESKSVFFDKLDFGDLSEDRKRLQVSDTDHVAGIKEVIYTVLIWNMEFITFYAAV